MIPGPSSDGQWRGWNVNGKRVEERREGELGRKRVGWQEERATGRKKREGQHTQL